MQGISNSNTFSSEFASSGILTSLTRKKQSAQITAPSFKKRVEYSVSSDSSRGITQPPAVLRKFKANPKTG
jgi:hypothetical protein